MRRGFKAEAERLSLGARSALEQTPNSKLDPWDYAKHLDVVVLEFEELKIADKHRRQLLEADPDSWSGLTLKELNRYFVVVNPRHARARQCSTLMHELAHIQLRHVPGQVSISATGLMLLSDYPDDQEQEADWLAAALLLPRDALHHYRVLGWNASQICELYCVSLQLCEWRLRMTGVDTQIGRTRRVG